ncbi:hypothetical protein [Noviherbaspirillum massiliense]|uniref:hypothetical protein n=1 Tax=Noviherbaspirillum massiliense TaxID=1465823 RepID=UPI0011DE2CE1|nr:hypothetical protein [Noviherbaspirillum massiliense]
MRSPLAGLGDLASLYETKPRSARRGIRLAMMLCIFLVGVAAGLSALWWIDRGNLQRLFVNVPPVRIFGEARTAAAAHESRQADAQAPARVPAISRDELPYDGNPPEYQQAPLAPSTSVAVRTVPQEPVVAAEPARSSGSSADEESSSEQASIGTQDSGKEVQQAAENAPDRHAADSSAPSRTVARKAAKPSHKHRAQTKAAKDTEISRIRQQAADELKKKSDGPNPAGAPASQTSRSQAGSIGKEANARTVSPQGSASVVLARCERASNIILREKCKWEICSGKWGKNGCPSYQTTTTMQ